jgi:hypothetical protein
MPEVSLYGICPRARFGAWPLLLSQNDKDGCRGVPERARSKQPKVPNTVLMGFRNVLLPHELQSAQAQATQSDLILEFREQGFHLSSLPLPVGKGGSVDEVSGGLNGAGALVDRVLRFINN